VQPWESVDWTATRRFCAPIDLYYKPSRVYKTMIGVPLSVCTFPHTDFSMRCG